MMYLALAGACLMGSAPAAPILTDPYAIFAAARTHWESANYPSQLSYTVGVTVSRHGVASEAHYHSYYDSLVNRVNVTAVSDEEIAHPYTPHGISVFFSPFGAHIPLSSPEHTFDYLGVPVLAPNYSFGISTYVPRSPEANSAELVAEIRREFCDPPPVKRPLPDSGLKTIASIDVVRRAYIITLNGITALNGHKDYDLTLRPIRDPGRYRLRQLWIDTGSFATDKLISQGNFTEGGMTWANVISGIVIAPMCMIPTAWTWSGTAPGKRTVMVEVSSGGEGLNETTGWSACLPPSKSDR